jgi:divalent metal cation (Fe/Co/Zn/Cd) transporter
MIDSTKGLSASQRATAPQRHNARMQVGSYLKISIAVALATIVLKFGAWWLTDSVGLLSDALESVVNLAGAVFALMMVTVTTRQNTFRAVSRAC